MLAKGVSADKVNYIAYGTDVDMFNPAIDSLSIRKELNLDNKFVVLYAGALGQANDIDTLLRAAERLKKYDKIHFVFFGDGKDRARLKAEAKRMGLTNVLCAGTRPKKEMPLIVASADACLAILQDIPAFRTTYPNKVFDYMAAGRASIIAIDGITRELIESSRGGVYVNPADDTMLAQKILEMSRDPALTSVAAFADDCNHPSNYHSAEVPAAMPVAPVGEAGRYELRTTQKYVQGRYETVTVQECREKRHGWRRHTVCRPVTQSQWIPGGFQSVQEWVWIPAPTNQQYSQYPGHRPPMYSQGRVGFHVSIR